MYLDTPTAARMLGISERHLTRLRHEHKIGYVRVGRRVRFRRTDLNAYMKKRYVKATVQIEEHAVHAPPALHRSN
jgi:excisionase family DNA binding protein